MLYPFLSDLLLHVAIMQDEIYDMVKPTNPLQITLQDLITRYMYLLV